MVYDAETGARNAEQDTRNDPGYCQQQTRQWSGIAALYGDAATAWENTNDRHPGDRHPPRGAHVFWKGGSKGYGHVAMSLGNQQIRSTDAGGSGVVATRHIDWVTQNWGLPYAGWAWDNNEVTIPHGSSAPPAEEDDVPEYVHVSHGERNIQDDEWHYCKWTKVHADTRDVVNPDNYGLKLRDRRYQTTLTMQVTVEGERIATRTVEGYARDGTWHPEEYGDVVEHMVTGGDTYLADCRPGWTPDKEGAQLRWQFRLPPGGRIVRARQVCLYWL